MTWYEELEQKYNHLFQTNENGIPLRGIECGKGWEQHIIQLLETFDWHTKNNIYIENPDTNSSRKFIPKPEGKNFIKIFQIKEKFGSARVYYSFDNPRLTDMLATAVGVFEGKCQLTCQDCGKLQHNCIRKSDNGWIYCLCDDCFNTFINERK